MSISKHTRSTYIFLFTFENRNRFNYPRLWASSLARMGSGVKKAAGHESRNMCCECQPTVVPVQVHRTTLSEDTKCQNRRNNHPVVAKLTMEPNLCRFYNISQNYSVLLIILYVNIYIKFTIVDMYDRVW